jgi:hypothetical protein
MVAQLFTSPEDSISRSDESLVTNAMIRDLMHVIPILFKAVQNQGGSGGLRPLVEMESPHPSFYAGS